MTSFSALAGDSGAGQRGHQDPDREDGAEQGSPLPLAGLKGSNRVGECLHELLERWDFRSRPVAHLLPTLRKHGLANLLVDERPLAETLQDELPRWSLARIPGLGSLAEAAGDPRLSEWHFVLPLRPQGVGGADLAGAFAAHPDPALRDYAISLALLSPERVQGMLQGYIDRLAHADGRWGVLDWKSNTLGVHAEDFSPGRMLEEAMQHHYVLQLFLYLVALRRYLRGRGQAFQLAGASLVFLRALRADSEAGILHFEAEPAVLDRLDALFTGVSA
jgi:exodeoxyribonuclease V beta subunit